MDFFLAYLTGRLSLGTPAHHQISSPAETHIILLADEKSGRDERRSTQKLFSTFLQEKVALTQFSSSSPPIDRLDPFFFSGRPHQVSHASLPRDRSPPSARPHLSPLRLFSGPMHHLCLTRAPSIKASHVRATISPPPPFEGAQEEEEEEGNGVIRGGGGESNKCR